MSMKMKLTKLAAWLAILLLGIALSSVLFRAVVAKAQGGPIQLKNQNTLAGIGIRYDPPGPYTLPAIPQEKAIEIAKNYVGEQDSAQATSITAQFVIFSDVNNMTLD